MEMGTNNVIWSARQAFIALTAVSQLIRDERLDIDLEFIVRKTQARSLIPGQAAVTDIADYRAHRRAGKSL